MQARRRVEPTGTNRPTGLIAPVIRVRTGSAAAEAGEARDAVTNKTSSRRCHQHACRTGHTPSQHPAKAKSQTNCDAPVWWPERRAQNPIPSRTRPLNTPAPMVLCLKTRESRSPPDPHNANPAFPLTDHRSGPRRSLTQAERRGIRRHLGAGWSSPVARQAHNLTVTGTNPVPATKQTVRRPRP